jgi:hypothetical protein
MELRHPWSVAPFRRFESLVPEPRTKRQLQPDLRVIFADKGAQRGVCFQTCSPLALIGFTR